ncbi:hypothetical protein HJG60_011884 [Phyllostomus discolor]|uniref:Uncharacterized protein n=1 Tax=Phyllostomus discolor TaxID=89673 RepID=A0A834DWF6_9CHIR|nr:hypothetical protein HJG60_011884 [Phyllostomus discolor]
MPTVPFSGKPLIEIVAANKRSSPQPCALKEGHLTTLASADKNRNPLVLAGLKHLVSAFGRQRFAFATASHSFPRQPESTHAPALRLQPPPYPHASCGGRGPVARETEGRQGATPTASAPGKAGCQAKPPGRRRRRKRGQ